MISISIIEDNKQQSLIKKPRSPSIYIGVTAIILFGLSSLIPLIVIRFNISAFPIELIDFCVVISYVLGMISLALGILDIVRKRDLLDCFLGIGLGMFLVFFWIYNLMRAFI